jgi:hypothetical protein
LGAVVTGSACALPHWRTAARAGDGRWRPSALHCEAKKCPLFFSTRGHADRSAPLVPFTPHPRLLHPRSMAAARRAPWPPPLPPQSTDPAPLLLHSYKSGSHSAPSAALLLLVLCSSTSHKLGQGHSVAPEARFAGPKARFIRGVLSHTRPEPPPERPGGARADHGSCQENVKEKRMTH